MREVLPLSTKTSVEAELRRYLDGIIAGFGTRRALGLAEADAEAVAAQIFAVLTDRSFSHLSRGRTMPYRARAVRALDEDVRRGAALQFAYDVGPGYHASLRPGQLEPSFEIGLSELLVLHQINSFCDRAVELYPPGAQFSLVVDNLCALRTNDVAVERTSAYCARFRGLISELGLDHRVELLVESEQFELERYDRVLAGIGVQTPAVSLATPDAIENVERFLGRRCTPLEAADRIERYRRAGIATERLLAGVVRGVRMTQRATAETLGFRAFPGGDVRTQCGQVVIGPNAKGQLRPFLLTSRNLDGFVLTPFRFPARLPAAIARVSYAEPVLD